MFDFINRMRYKGKMKQIGFIVGTGRCGTTILASVLNAHSRISIPHELQIIINRGLYEKYASGEAINYRADDFIDLIRDRCPYHFVKYFDYVSHFKQLRYPQKDLRTLLSELFDHMCYKAGKEVFLEQTPYYGQHLDVLKVLFPSMKVIHLIRDGRDVATSYARTPWWTKDITTNLERWAKVVNLIHASCEQNPKDFLELRYEDLVVEPRVALLKILSLFDLGYESGMLDPLNLIDYFAFAKGDAMAVQSDQFKEWGQEKSCVFFPESIYGWKRQKEKYEVLSDEVRRTLNLFSYET